MALIEIRKTWRREEKYVSISGAHRRIVLFKRVYEMMRERMGQDFDYVKFFVDSKMKGKFWMRPDLEEGVHIRKSGSNRLLSVAPLLESLGWGWKETIRAPVTWDAKNNAFQADFYKGLKEQEEESRLRG
jgi:hypothetical protein